MLQYLPTDVVKKNILCFCFGVLLAQQLLYQVYNADRY